MSHAELCTCHRDGWLTTDKREREGTTRNWRDHEEHCRWDWDSQMSIERGGRGRSRGGATASLHPLHRWTIPPLPAPHRTAPSSKHHSCEYYFCGLFHQLLALARYRFINTFNKPVFYLPTLAADVYFSLYDASWALAGKHSTLGQLCDQINEEDYLLSWLSFVKSKSSLY